jgi:Myb-like DNA-binding domain
MDQNPSISDQLKQLKDKAFHLEGDIWLVPCVKTNSEGSYQPLLKPLDNSLKSNQYTKKQLWAPSEDETLLRLVTFRGSRAWGCISKELNSIVHKGLNIRQGRQCRERWFNHLDPNLNKGSWTRVEDEILIQKQSQLGNQWREISKFLTGRNENNIKNRWKSILKHKDLKDHSLNEDLSVNSDNYSFLSSPRLDFSSEESNNVSNRMEKKLRNYITPSNDISNYEIFERDLEDNPEMYFLSIY